jgi:hypothetical protein
LIHELFLNSRNHILFFLKYAGEPHIISLTRRGERYKGEGINVISLTYFKTQTPTLPDRILDKDHHTHPEAHQPDHPRL